MARPILIGLLIALGLSAIVIGLSVFILGAAETSRVVETAYGHLAGSAPVTSTRYSTRAEQVIRVFTAFWIVYGVILVATALNLKRWAPSVPGLATVLFLGGLGRLFAYRQFGSPHRTFVVMMVVELALPPVLVALWAAARRDAGGGAQRR
ncbi:MAG TPA: DUF4345 domain-containing protein [Caulobacteraceae bacterium]|jgi:hypothetical protein